MKPKARSFGNQHLEDLEDLEDLELCGALWSFVGSGKGALGFRAELLALGARSFALWVMGSQLCG
jgi:hypothetical protein